MKNGLKCACSIGALVVASLGVEAASVSASAQEASAANANEIIVTARKRDESALRVPVIETVISGADIERASITELEDIANFAPSLVVGESVLAVGAQVSIRGIGTTSLDPGVDQSVALVIDGFSFSQGLAFQSGTFDLAQIEVLKGPQALFFGKSSPAGVIAIRTADPGDELEVIARGSYEFEAKTRRAELIVSTPLSDGLGLRLAGQYHKSDGFFYNRDDPLPGTGVSKPGKRLGGNEGFHIRGTLLYEPSSDLSARLKLNYVDDFDEFPGALQLASCPEGVATQNFLLPPTINPNDSCKINRTFYMPILDPVSFPGGLNKKGGMPYSDKQQFYGTLEINYNPADAITLTSVTGYYDIDFESYFNTFNASYSGTFFSSSALYDRKEFTQELRLNTDFDSPLNFTLGGFYQNTDIDYLQSTGPNFAYKPIVEAVAPAYVAAFFGGPLLTSQGGPLDIESISAYGQLRYKPSPQFEIAIGGRYTDETRKIRVFNDLTGAELAVAKPKISSGTFSPEATLTYYPNDDVTLFASYKKGYKSGSYSLTRLPAVDPGQLPDNSFGDEKAQGGEIGLKSRLADRQLALNVAGYYYKFSGLQFSTSQGYAGSELPTTRVVNAGSARVYGIDIEANYRPRAIEGLSVNAAVNWNNNKFTDLAGIPCYGGQTIALGCTQSPNGSGLFTAQENLKGLSLPRAPKWSANFGFAYEMPLSGGMNLTLSNDNHYSSRQLIYLGKRDDAYQGEFLKIDAGLALSGRDDKWELALIGKNLTNQITTGNCVPSNQANGFFGRSQTTGGTTSGNDGLDELGCIPERGRSVMVRLTFRPFG